MTTTRQLIMHVDDDHAILKIVAKRLNPNGFEVISVTEPKNVVRELVKNKCRVVLLDIDMPEKNGLDVLREIKAHDAISLGSLLGLETLGNSAETTIRGILITCKQGTACLLVDAIIGQRKVVINNLSDIMSNTDKVSGVAQLGGGQLALVLNPTELVNFA